MLGYFTIGLCNTKLTNIRDTLIQVPPSSKFRQVPSSAKFQVPSSEFQDRVPSSAKFRVPSSAKFQVPKFRSKFIIIISLDFILFYSTSTEFYRIYPS